MVTCSRGHDYRGNENYRAGRGCPVCFKAVRARYKASEKGRASTHRYEQTEKAQEVRRKRNARSNARRIRVGSIYLGTCGFTVTETEAILDGSTD